jgi:hypothetical protein
MPATSEKQRRLFAIAEHHPEQLYARNRRLAKLSRQTLRDFATSQRPGLRAAKSLSAYAK